MQDDSQVHQESCHYFSRVRFLSRQLKQHEIKKKAQTKTHWYKEAYVTSYSSRFYLKLIKCKMNHLYPENLKIKTILLHLNKDRNRTVT